jgi:hypothetical protein
MDNINDGTPSYHPCLFIFGYSMKETNHWAGAFCEGIPICGKPMKISPLLGDFLKQIKSTSSSANPGKRSQKVIQSSFISRNPFNPQSA